MEEGLNALPTRGAAKAAKMNETAVTILVIVKQPAVGYTKV